ncbi:MAG TPA: hypothetical protein VF625_00245 [Longimicrobium sp.]
MTDKDLAIGEFSIMELEDRLEFAELCDDNCGCGSSTGGGGGGVTVGTGTVAPTEPSFSEPSEPYYGGGGGGGGGGFEQADQFQAI